jgi:hypothetical protein
MVSLQYGHIIADYSSLYALLEPLFRILEHNLGRFDLFEVGLVPPAISKIVLVYKGCRDDALVPGNFMFPTRKISVWFIPWMRSLGK